MKIKSLQYLLLLSIILIGCKEDDNTSGTFIGTWEAISIEISDCENFTLNGPQLATCNETSCYRLTLTDSSTYNFQKGLEGEVGTWSASGASLTFCTDEEGVETCNSASGVISSIGLTLSFVEGNVGCVTTYIMERAESDTTGTN